MGEDGVDAVHDGLNIALNKLNWKTNLESDE